MSTQGSLMMGQPLHDIGMVLSDIVAALSLKAQHAGQSACWASDGLTPEGQRLLEEAKGAVGHLRAVAGYFGVAFKAPFNPIERPAALEQWVYDLMIRALYEE